jgi:protein-disulfide isomerase
MSAKLETLSSAVITVCALLVTGLFVRRQLFVSARVEAQPRTPTYVENWAELVRTGSRIGPEAAAVQIVEFGDFQCPFCKRFHESMLAVMSERPGVASLVYRHFPLSYHAHALPAARAGECAGEQGRFEAMAGALFAAQDSIGLTPWVVFAGRAGVGDTLRFKACFEGDTSSDRLAADREAAGRLGIGVTPTVFINGWRLPVPPGLDTLRWLVGEFAAGRVPFRRG